MPADSVDARSQGKVDDSRQHFLRIINHRTRLGARNQRAVGSIGTVRKRLSSRRQPCGLSCRNQLGIWEPEQEERAVDGEYGSGNRIGYSAVSNSHVIERTVRLDVLQANALLGGDASEGVYLAHDQVGNLGRWQLHFPTSEMLTVRKAGVGADGNAMLARQVYRFTHAGSAACVPSTGDVGGSNTPHQCRILPAFLPYISIEVDPKLL
jgi:hypothetical protein